MINLSHQLQVINQKMQIPAQSASYADIQFKVPAFASANSPVA